jgi:hypothetical protein
MPEEPVLEAKNEEANRESVLAEQGNSPETPEVIPVQEKETRPEASQEHAEGKYNEILSKVSSQSAAALHTDEDASLDAKSIGATIDEESKIQKLLDLAGAKGVAHAVRVARTLDDYYALDQMHDALADRLYDGLLERGLIRKD